MPCDGSEQRLAFAVVYVRSGKGKSGRIDSESASEIGHAEDAVRFRWRIGPDPVTRTPCRGCISRGLFQCFAEINHAGPVQRTQFLLRSRIAVPLFGDLADRPVLGSCKAQCKLGRIQLVMTHHHLHPAGIVQERIVRFFSYGVVLRHCRRSDLVARLNIIVRLDILARLDIIVRLDILARLDIATRLE